MKNRLPPEKFTENDLNILCRGVTQACISAAGRVLCLSLSWWSDELKELGSSLKKGQQAKCYYNPLDLGEIWVAHPDDCRKPVLAYATYPEYQNGLTLTEHNLLHQQHLAEGRVFDDSKADVALYQLRRRTAIDYENSRHQRHRANTKRKASPDTADPNAESTTLMPDETLRGAVDIPTFMVERL